MDRLWHLLYFRRGYGKGKEKKQTKFNEDLMLLMLSKTKNRDIRPLGTRKMDHQNAPEIKFNDFRKLFDEDAWISVLKMGNLPY